MAVPMVAVFVVILVAGMAGLVGLGKRGFMVMLMVVIVDMKARGGNSASDVPMYARCRRPSELERDNEHDDQHGETSHGVHSTEFRKSANCGSWLLLSRGRKLPASMGGVMIVKECR